ncbi:MAG: hypothetical protein U0936_24360 [Planctomycetaceae bacterium]
MVRKNNSPNAESVVPPSDSSVIPGIERLADEISGLRQVLDEIREELSWVTRNGIPVQPIEHIHVTRMARDVTAGNWKERLKVERHSLHPPGQLDGLGTLELNRLAADLQNAVERLAIDKLAPILQLMEEVRSAVSQAILHSATHPDGGEAKGGNFVQASQFASIPVAEKLPGGNDEVPLSPGKTRRRSLF